MKIYCRTREYENKLDQYVGKDVWIKMRHMSHSYWVNLLCVQEYRIAPGTPLVQGYKGITIWTGSHYRSVQELVWVSECTRTIDSSYYIDQPLEVRTTEELMEMLVDS